VPEALRLLRFDLLVYRPRDDGVDEAVRGATVVVRAEQRSGQPMVHIAADGVTSFGSARVSLTGLIPRVTNIIIP
jgi:hypothetical protein